MSPVITLTFNAKDLPLIVMLQERLGVGHIYKNKGSNAYTYRILNYKNLALLIPPSLCFFFVLLLSFVKLKIKKKKDGAPYIYIYIYIHGGINGYMRTPKINQLNNLIYYLNKKGYNIDKYPLDCSALNSNAWLSGFLEADGHFSVRVSVDQYNKLKIIGPGTACYLEICQRQKELNGNSFYNVLTLIGKILLCKVNETKSTTKNPQYRVRTTSLRGNINLANYLNNYPLFSSKFLDYIDWLRVLKFYETKEHKIKYYEIVKIKSFMNDRRTFFCWDHLQNFYNLHN